MIMIIDRSPQIKPLTIISETRQLRKRMRHHKLQTMPPRPSAPTNLSKTSPSCKDTCYRPRKLAVLKVYLTALRKSSQLRPLQDQFICEKGRLVRGAHKQLAVQQQLKQVPIRRIQSLKIAWTFRVVACSKHRP